MNTLACQTSAEIRTVIESVASGALTALPLLRAIETTIDSVIRYQAIFEANTQFFRKTAESFRTCPRVRMFDPDGTLAAGFAEAVNQLNRVREVYAAKIAALERASELRDEHRGSIVDAYRSVDAALIDLCNAMADAAWEIGEHDADLSQRGDGPVLRTPQEISDYLDTL
jgi:hypothetical protein